ncbi:RNA-binding protein [Variovorax sp. GT1P44]|uniref:RNA-binding protein n=1 Tax=Variovorax sp. GT1P44 TaxID=3443742 RepID=UPI003F48E76A
MARMLLGNIESGTSEDEVKAFLVKYGFPEFDEVEHVPGDGSRPAMLLTFRNVQPEGLRKLKERIHDMYWKKGRLTARVLSDDFA